MVARIVAPEAKEDLRHIAVDLARDAGLSVSAATLARIRRSFMLLGRHPYVGSSRDGDLGTGLRSLPSSGYIIVYRATPKVVTILRVIDGRRDYPAIIQP